MDTESEIIQELDEISPPMDLRDWFAGHAPPAPSRWFLDEPGINRMELEVSWAYSWADAMLRKRKESNKEVVDRQEGRAVELFRECIPYVKDGNVKLLRRIEQFIEVEEQLLKETAVL